MISTFRFPKLAIHMHTAMFDFPARLLADTSDAMLLVWADVLEEAEDPACEGVRDLLVGKDLRPYDNGRSFGWSKMGTRPKCTLPVEVFEAIPGTMGYATWRFYRKEELTPALAHYTALHDAATAYVMQPEEWKQERRERLTKETAR